MLLRASKGDQWTACAGSAQAQAQVEDAQSSIYALEGTKAHKILETCLKSRYLPDDPVFEATTEMSDAVKVALDWVDRNYSPSSGDKLEVEKYVTAEPLTQANIAGTADIIIRKATGLVMVADFKYGMGIQVQVPCHQLNIYALGAVADIPSFIEREVETTIIQPRGEGQSIRSATLDNGELNALALFYEDKAKAAMGPSPELTPGEKQCRWCSAKAGCPAVQEQVANVIVEATGPRPPGELSEATVVKLLENLDVVESWLAEFREFAVGNMMRGSIIPGWKVVEGRSLVKWQHDPETISNKFGSNSGIKLKRDTLYNIKRTPKTPTQLMKSVKAVEPEKLHKAQRLVNELAGPSVGKPKLARADDPKPWHPDRVGFIELD